MSNTSKLVLFGCDHRFQKNGLSFLKTEDELTHREQQKEFLRSLAELFLEERFTLVAEEMTFHELSTVQSMAYAFHVQYINVDMPLTARTKAGCPQEYHAMFDFYGQLNNEDPQVIKEKIQRCDELREEYMVNRITEFASEYESVLFVCGLNHADRIAERCGKIFSQMRRINISEFKWLNKALYMVHVV